MATERERAERFAGELASVYGAELASVVLYGSVARNEHRPGLSDVNVLVLLARADAATLRRGHALTRKWTKDGNPPPLVLSLDEWRGSADVFPIELTDIRDAHVTLHGTDPFDAVEIHRADLRRQVEFELKGKQIQLRERYLAEADRPAELGDTLVKALPTFLVLFRTVLRLSGAAVPRGAEEVIEATAARVGFDAAPLREVQRARAGGGRLRPAADSAVVAGFLEAVAEVVAYVDRLDPGAPGAPV